MTKPMLKIDWRELCNRAGTYFVRAKAEGRDKDGQVIWTWVGYDAHPTYPLVTQMAKVYGGEPYCTSDFPFPSDYPERVFLA